MNRLVFVHGPWQLLIAASALGQASRSRGKPSRDTLVLFSLHDGPLSPGIRRVMEQIAEAVWPWHRIVALDGATRRDPDDVRGSTADLRTALGEGRPDEVWLDCLWGLPEKIAAEAYPSARLVLYEDGLQTYLPHGEDTARGAGLKGVARASGRALKLRLRELRHPDDLSIALMLPRHLARVSASYLWISRMIPPAGYQLRLPWVQLRTRHVRRSLDRIAPIVEPIAPGPGPVGVPRALVLGQCFSNYGDLPREVERDCYLEMATRLDEMGYEVLWKEHPRTREPFFPQLAAALPSLRGAPDWGPWPVELFVDRLGIAACASISSTSLFSLPILFNLPTFSPAARLLPLFRFPNNELARLAARAVPPIPDRVAATAQLGHQASLQFEQGLAGTMG